MASANGVEDIAVLLTKTTVKPINIVRLSKKGLKLDTEEDVAVVIKDINESKDVQALSLEGNTLGVEAAQAIAVALSKRPEFEKALWNDMFTGRLRSEIPIALECLGDAIIYAGAHLTELDLCDNAFGPDGVKAVTKLLTSPSCFSLQVLKFNNNGLGIGGGKILSEALLQCHKASLEAGTTLKLRVFVAGRNRLENEGAAALAESFKAIGTLEEISMPQNGINHQGVSALAKAFKSNKHLKVINLNDNIFTAKAAIAVAKVLHNLPDLEVINFGDCLVKPQGALAIGKALKENHFNLKELILAFGDINNESAMCVVEAMENKKNLEKLDLNGNCFGDDGIESIRSKLKEFHREEALGSLSEDEGEDEDDDDDDDEDDEEEDEDDEDDEEEEEEEEQQEEKKEESSNSEEKEKQENKKEEEVGEKREDGEKHKNDKTKEEESKADLELLRNNFPEPEQELKTDENKANCSLV